MRSRLLVAAGLLVLVGCGERSGDHADPGDPPGAAAVDTPALDRPWLAGFEAGSGEVPDGTTYIRFVPATGETVVTELRHAPFDSEPNPTTLVDADRSWAVVANAASRAERRGATVTVASLTGAEDREVDLRAASGFDALRPLGWAFDPTESGLLRVLDRSGRLFEVPLGGGEPRELDRVEPGPGQALAPLFDSATGMPLLRDTRTYEPVGGSAYHAGGTVLVDAYDVPHTGLCRDSSAEAAVVDDEGTTWAACLQGRELRLARDRGEAQDDWEQVGASAAAVPREVASITTLLPPL